MGSSRRRADDYQRGPAPLATAFLLAGLRPIGAILGGRRGRRVAGLPAQTANALAGQLCHGILPSDRSRNLDLTSGGVRRRNAALAPLGRLSERSAAALVRRDRASEPGHRARVLCGDAPAGSAAARGSSYLTHSPAVAAVDLLSERHRRGGGLDRLCARSIAEPLGGRW